MVYRTLKYLKGYLDVWLAPFLRLLWRLGVRPTHISVLSLFAGVSGVFLIYRSPLEGFVLVVSYVVLDVLDGCLARVTDSVTDFGAKFDFATDRVVAGYFLIEYYLWGGDPFFSAFGLTAVLAVSLEDFGLIKR